MKIVVVGATGLIGQAVVARLSQDDHEVIAAGRLAPASLQFGAVAWRDLDLSEPDLEAWTVVLANADVLVNCAGVLQDSVDDSTEAVHETGVAVMFAACAQAGVRRVIHFSAVGVNRHQASAFSRTKHAGEVALEKVALDWIVLRPSVVLGRQVFGASALFRGLSALPILPVVRGTGQLQVIVLDDVAETVAILVKAEAPARVAIDLTGPEALTMTEVIGRLRQWQGSKPARTFELPGFLSVLLYSAGDVISLLGWRPPIRTTAAREITYGALGNNDEWRRILGRSPVSLDTWLRLHPPGVQDRWFSKLYFVKPVLFAVLSAFWVATGIISLTVGYEIGVDLMIEAGTGPLAAPGVVAGALADIVIGSAIAWRRASWYGLWGGMALSVFYAVSGSVLLPELWREPLGPLLKIWPILVAHLVALAILKER